MNINAINLPDFTAISFEELQNKYEQLFNDFQDLKTLHDGDNQQIYELRRNLTTVKAGEAHLAEELELVASTQKHEIDQIISKHNGEIEHLKRNVLDKNEINNSLEQNLETLKQENVDLKTKLDVLTHSLSTCPKAFASDDNYEKDLHLVKDNLELLSKLDEFEDKLQRSLMTIAERESQIEINKEHILCLEETLNIKRQKLDEQTEILESAQERIIEMNSEIAMYKTEPGNEHRKGNSLFAEVDDQRQVMKQILVAQKKGYLQMKKSFNQSEHEIRRLKRENSAMHNELQTCISIFMNAEKTYKEQLNKRIHQLMKENDRLEKKLRWTEERLVKLGNEKGINWLDSMLSFCKAESNELRSELKNCRIQKSQLEQNIQNSKQDCAKWRFEALKSRCIIIDRESLLEENQIKFKNFTSKDIEVGESELESAMPQIMFSRRRRRSLLDELKLESETPTADHKCPIQLLTSTQPNDSVFEILDSPNNHYDIVKNNSASKGNHLTSRLFDIFEDNTTFMTTSDMKQEFNNESVSAKITPNKFSHIKVEDQKSALNLSSHQHQPNIIQVSENILPSVQVKKSVSCYENLMTPSPPIQKPRKSIQLTQTNPQQLEVMTSSDDDIKHKKSIRYKENRGNSMTPSPSVIHTPRKSITLSQTKPLKLQVIDNTDHHHHHHHVKPLQPILMKESNQSPSNSKDFKYVKFNESTIQKQGSAVKSVTKLTKSNIVIRKFEMKSVKK